jgi:hypothetical protein
MEMNTPQQPPQEDPGSSLISDEKRQNLFYAMGRLKAQAEDTKMRINSSQIRLETERKKKLGEIFSKMKLGGVDLSSRESVSDYINRLKQNNPETAVMFENAMGYLMSGKTNMNNEKLNETLPEDSRGYSS